ncbi:nucleoside diphosphate kinase regulator [Planctomycetes bacterium K23_9]|uniref:Regulator of nucleoside diphosphate kinase n=1 Tax=Stieleria marina TaxID=1930275 RepID=A0A517NVH8_9BACT|nr:Regulator of nucleoside diphosphate kinase [Planctomycetes bacterium K23_9]
MASRKIHVTREDFSRLTDLMNDEWLAAIVDRRVFRELIAELEQAVIVDSAAIPPDVVTMNSIVKMTDLKTGDVDTYTLVYPKEANIAESRLSILAPIGTAILGYAVGDRVRWNIPSGRSNMRIDEVVYQPERDAAVV